MSTQPYYIGSVAAEFLSVGNNSEYSEGTASASGTTVTGVGTTFTPSMVGGTITFENGARGVINTFINTSTLTTDDVVDSAESKYTIYYGGMSTNGAHLHVQTLCSMQSMFSGQFQNMYGTLPMCKKITLSSSELMNLKASPKELLAAPDAGNFYQITSVTLAYRNGTQGYSGGSSTLELYYGAKELQMQAVALDLSSSVSNTLSMTNISVTNVDPLKLTGKSVVLSHQGAGEFTNGNGTLDVYISWQKTIV
jgi:hypothetical protein